VSAKRSSLRRAANVLEGANILVSPPRRRNNRLGLWVPAFAGTTLMDSNFKQQHSLTRFRDLAASFARVLP
jgi:hypothetical protein